MNNWKDKYGEWALITGASSGIGADFVRQLAEKGMNIILTARRTELMETIAKEVEDAYGIKTQIISQDLIEPDAVEKIKSGVSDKEVGILINNAGYGSLGRFHENDMDYQTDMVILNCVAPVALTAGSIS